jgi:hypothetical protein
MDGAYTFRADYNKITPMLEAAVGRVILEWTTIDHLVTGKCELFWQDMHPGDRIPRPFDKRAKAFKDYGRHLFIDRLNSPDEWLTLAWFIERLRNLSYRRDDIAHGFAGEITQNGKTYEGLMVPRPSHETRLVPLSTEDVVRFGYELRAFRVEFIELSHPFYLAHVAAWPDRRGTLGPDGLPVTKENRSLRLPRRGVPPPSFRP